jgi:Pyruvate/2-oxoacid:ferredoxin oxidoreductase delta subunit
MKPTSRLTNKPPKRKRKDKVRRNRETNSMCSLTLCFCPKCEENHYLFIFWTGRGTPYKYCKGCQGQDELNVEPVWDIRAKLRRFRTGNNN